MKYVHLQNVANTERFYTGITDDLRVRLWKHNSGLVRSRPRASIRENIGSLDRAARLPKHGFREFSNTRIAPPKSRHPSAVFFCRSNFNTRIRALDAVRSRYEAAAAASRYLASARGGCTPCAVGSVCDWLNLCCSPQVQ